MLQQNSRLIGADNIFPVFYCSLLNFCELQLPVFSWQKQQPVWFFAAVSGSTFYAFKDALLLKLRDYLSYYCFPSFKQSGYSPLASTRHFHPQDCRSLYIFSFLGPLSGKLYRLLDICINRLNKQSVQWTLHLQNTARGSHVKMKTHFIVAEAALNQHIQILNEMWMNMFPGIQQDIC